MATINLLHLSADKQQILDTMKRVYRWQAANQTRSVIRRTGKTRFIKDTDWERGVFWATVTTAWKATGDNDYLQGAMNYTLHTGFRTGPTPRFADDIVCCQSYLDVYPLIGHPEALEPTIAALNIMLDNPEAGRKDWWWCDSLFMAPPVFAALSQETGDKRYLNYMNTAWWDSVEHLQDPETNLFYRDYRYIPNNQGSELREANGQKVFWSRGIGWVLAAIPRILNHMPETFADRSRYLTMFKTLASEIIKYQQPDGFWRSSLLDPKSFSAPESSATALFCYGLAWGVHHEELDKEVYLPIIEKAWAALQTAIHDNGMLGWVQLPAFNPRDVSFDHNMDYGAGAFLLAATEMIALTK
ncbi:glycoside hydrolase family 88 protein [Jinshanibacter sp. LJY008]|uniref:Glycoside hydrolase family 88 protein n=1 Tax=Limnobaculum eriocheiris TaxID=2897391 RepID=A0A9X1MVD9_9GAMM|nr:glycoside hydrolase family 88 protein [Limnobaculum eriocheiris]MCD1125333.1 glycoside hydrolase family 88 protein [Limnobaculum eriocheiris]